MLGHRCGKCRESLEQLTHLPKRVNQPTYDIFRCRACGVVTAATMIESGTSRPPQMNENKSKQHTLQQHSLAVLDKKQESLRDFTNLPLDGSCKVLHRHWLPEEKSLN